MSLVLTRMLTRIFPQERKRIIMVGLKDHVLANTVSSEGVGSWWTRLTSRLGVLRIWGFRNTRPTIILAPNLAAVPLMELATRVAKATDGFSGRELAKLVLRIQVVLPSLPVHPATRSSLSRGLHGACRDCMWFMHQSTAFGTEDVTLTYDGFFAAVAAAVKQHNDKVQGGRGFRAKLAR
jgi:hypothetical protein